MLNYAVKLKPQNKIKELCYETENGGIGQDFIAFDGEVLTANKFYNDGVTLVGVEKLEEGLYAYLIKQVEGKKIYVHLDWLDEVNGHKVLDNLNQSKEIIKITNKEIFYPSTGKIDDIGKMPICNCGEMGTVQMDDGGWICNSCLEDLTKINGYSFKPTPDFTGKQLKADAGNPVWYGMEIEVATDKDKLAKYMYKHKKGVYLKSDSSIDGSGYRVEMVTHPHSFSELMSSDTLTDLADIPTEDTDRNGLHIHISRTAFVDNRHYSLFYFLLHKMEKLAVKVGGRELTEYCRLRPEGRVHRKTNTKGGAERTLFLNETNDNTIEARFFKSTTDPKRLKADVQLLESVIKYTKYHTKEVSTKGWYGYIRRKSSKYAELIEVLGTLDVNTLTDRVVYREPVLATKKLNECTVFDFDNMYTIKTVDRKEYKDVTISRVYNRERILQIQTSSHGYVDIGFDKIKEIIVEQE